MNPKNCLLFLLSIFIQLFGMDEPKKYFPLLEVPQSILKRIGSNYLDDGSMCSLICTCSLLHKQNLGSIFIRDKDEEWVKDRYNKLIRFPNIANEYYRDNFDLCTSALSFFAQHCTEDVQDEYKKGFEQLYCLHADERNAGIMAVLDIKEAPSTEDCIRVYSGDCRRQSDHGLLYHGKLLLWGKESAKHILESSYGERLAQFFENANVQAINTMLCDSLICKELCNYDYATAFIKSLCSLDHCYIKKILKDNGFYRMPLLVSNRYSNFELIRKSITVKIFARIIQDEKENLIDIICEDIEPNNSGLYFLIWMHNFVYPKRKYLKSENNFIKRFINTKKINLNQPDKYGERILDYVWSRVNYSKIIINQLIDLGCDMDAVDVDGKTLLQREGEKYYNSLLEDFGKGYSIFAITLLNTLLENKIKELIELKKINMPIDDYGNTVLHYASMFGLPSVVIQVFAAGANINAQNMAGMTPFFLSCLCCLKNASFEKKSVFWSSYNIINYLYDKGADINKADNENCLPWLIAFDALRMFNHKVGCPDAIKSEMVKKFFNRGANIGMFTLNDEPAYHDLISDSEIADLFFNAKMRMFKILAFCGLSALSVYGVFKYFQDK